MLNYIYKEVKTQLTLYSQKYETNPGVFLKQGINYKLKISIFYHKLKVLSTKSWFASFTDDISKHEVKGIIMLQFKHLLVEFKFNLNILAPTLTLKSIESAEY